MTLYLGLLVAYLALQVGIGVWLGRRVKTAGAIVVAGRQHGTGQMCSTRVPPNKGAGATQGAHCDTNASSGPIEQ